MRQRVPRIETDAPKQQQATACCFCSRQDREHVTTICLEDKCSADGPKPTHADTHRTRKRTQHRRASSWALSYHIDKTKFTAGINEWWAANATVSAAAGNTLSVGTCTPGLRIKRLGSRQTILPAPPLRPSYEETIIRIRLISPLFQQLPILAV